MKRIAIKAAGSEQPPVDVELDPGTTAGEILRELGLQGYLLSTGPNSSNFFGDSENVYPKVNDGDKLFATTRAEVGV